MNGERINILNFQIINWKKGPKRPKISFYCLKKKSHSIIFKKLPKMEKHKTIPSKICCSHNRWSQCWYVGETDIHRTHYLYAARKIRILGSKLPWDEFVLRQDSHSLYCSIIIKEEGLAILKRAGEGKVKQDLRSWSCTTHSKSWLLDSQKLGLNSPNRISRHMIYPKIGKIFRQNQVCNDSNSNTFC